MVKCNWKGLCCCGYERRFHTKRDKIKILEGYKEDLDKESQGISEEIV